MPPRTKAVFAFIIALLLAAPVASADPSGKSTLEETIAPGTGAFAPLTSGPGEKYSVRRAAGAKANAKRAARRRSLAFFGQITDPQIVDEESPARVDFVDPAGGALKSSHRPHEAFGLHTFAAVIRNMNLNRVSRVAAGGKKAKMSFAVTTGDLADNQQLNETRWFKAILEGGQVDPSSGKAISATNPCNGATAEEIARMNDDAARRLYTGVQDYDDYPDAPQDRYAGFWDPDVPSPSPYVQSPYRDFPRLPGVLDRAQQPFTSIGLDVPWLIARGNHDGLIQGNAPASTELFRSIATGCLKVFPSAAIDPNEFKGKDESFVFETIAKPEYIAKLLAGGRKVAPDPDRKIINKVDYKRQVGTSSGFNRVSKAENKASKGTASYYATVKNGIKFISLDTVSEGGSQYGNLDDPQYKWLEKELKASQKKRQLVIPFGHHPIDSMKSTRTDEQAGTCETPDEPGCDADPRKSTPLHLGKSGSRTVRDLFLKYPVVIAYVSGHIHKNKVVLYKKGSKSFWDIATASHIDWPQQSRTIQVMDNRDGTLSIFGTVLNSDAPIAVPTGTPSAFAPIDLASWSRTLSFNDPQRAGTAGSDETESGAGSKQDRNVELVIRNPALKVSRSVN
jgi:metallophosphoesterase (TIGR03767 family)